jgi:pimeloyl-ACP methyl ester carboxylesterase
MDRDRPLPHVDGVEHDYVDAGGLRTHVALAGPPDGDPILCVHGWPQHWYLWREVIGPFAAAGYRVICPDLRGCGWTEAPRNGYEKEQLADDLLALMDNLELGRVRYLGHDWGGFAGYLLCLREPERVERLMTLNVLPPFIGIRPSTLLGAWRFAYQLLLATPFAGERVAARLARLSDEQAARIGLGLKLWSADERATFLGQFAEPERAWATVQYYRTFQLREIPPLLAGRYRHTRLTTKTFLLFGVDDQAQDPRALRGSESRADDFRYELVDDCAHFIVDQRPELVVERALDFLI